MKKIKFYFKDQKYEIDISDDTKILKSNFIKPSNGSNSYVLDKSFFGEERIVNDVFRFQIKKESDSFQLIKNKDNLSVSESINHKIILLLESPHRDEYDKDFLPIGPAIGNTGKNIEKFLASSVIPLLINQGLKLENITYDVLIVNPVQYQASLGYVIDKKLNTGIRNNVWKIVFNETQIEFSNRLVEYEPSVILNFCTSDLKPELKRVLNIFFKQYPNTQFFEGSHPCIWNRIFSFKKINF